MKIDVKMVKKNGVFETNTVSLGEWWNGEDNEKAQKFEGKTEKF